MAAQVGRKNGRGIPVSLQWSARWTNRTNMKRPQCSDGSRRVARISIRLSCEEPTGRSRLRPSNGVNGPCSGPAIEGGQADASEASVAQAPRRVPREPSRDLRLRRHRRTVATAQALNRQEFAAALRGLAPRYWHNHPFHHRLHAGACSPGEVRAWVANRWYYQAVLAQK